MRPANSKKKWDIEGEEPQKTNVSNCLRFCSCFYTENSKGTKNCGACFGHVLFSRTYKMMCLWCSFLGVQENALAVNSHTSVRHLAPVWATGQTHHRPFRSWWTPGGSILTNKQIKGSKHGQWWSSRLNKSHTQTEKSATNVCYTGVSKCLCGAHTVWLADDLWEAVKKRIMKYHNYANQAEAQKALKPPNYFEVWAEAFCVFQQFLAPSASSPAPLL